MKKDLSTPPFIIIPGILLSDPAVSTITEKLYGVIYWMSKMTSHKCFASNSTLAKVLKCSPQTVANSLSLLEKSGYIRREFVGTSKRHRDEIVPLIDFNVDYSMKETSSPLGKTDYSERGTQITSKSNLDYSEREHNSIINNTKNNTINEKGSLNSTIALFEKIVPGDFAGKSNAFSKPPTRAAVEALLKRYSHDQIKDMIDAYSSTEGQEFRPSVGTVYEFCTYKLAKIESFLKKPRSRLDMLLHPYKKETPTKEDADWGRMVRKNKERRNLGLKPYKTEQEMYDDESKK